MVNGQPVYRDIANEVGIVSTPVISLDHNALYVVTFTKVGNGKVYMATFSDQVMVYGLLSSAGS